mgnify:CR=1 FL=1
MIRSTTFDDTYMLVDKQHYIVCIAYNLREIDNFLRNKSASDYTIIVKHFDIDKCGMIVKEYDSQWNVLNEGFLSYSEYGNTIWEWNVF